MRSDSSPGTIETARLRLRAYRADDLDRTAALYGHAQVAAFTKLGRQDRDQAAVILDDYIAARRKHGFGMRALFVKPDFDFAGECGLFLLSSGQAALRYALLPAFWGRGLAAEAVAASVDEAFTIHRLPRLHSIVQLRNIASIRVMEKLGWRIVRQDRERDSAIAIHERTREEWLAARAAAVPEPAGRD
jgi:RimJ/RimL family protein N-acetyltransferase